MGAAVLFLAAYAWPILDPSLAGPPRTPCSAVTWLTWITFVLDYLVRLCLAPDRGRFF
jgi:voltage-gated potassium channel